MLPAPHHPRAGLRARGAPGHLRPRGVLPALRWGRGPGGLHAGPRTGGGPGVGRGGRGVAWGVAGEGRGRRRDGGRGSRKRSQRPGAGRGRGRRGRAVAVGASARRERAEREERVPARSPAPRAARRQVRAGRARGGRGGPGVRAEPGGPPAEHLRQVRCPRGAALLLGAPGGRREGPGPASGARAARGDRPRREAPAKTVRHVPGARGRAPLGLGCPRRVRSGRGRDGAGGAGARRPRGAGTGPGPRGHRPARARARVSLLSSLHERRCPWKRPR